MEKLAELSRIIINEQSDQQVIVLKECDGDRQFPIVIGIAEVFAIDRRLKGLTPPRPMTHDLLDSVIRNLGATLSRVVVSDLRNHTFYAKLMLDTGDQTIEVDCRPSDAVALAVASQVPIYIAEHVLRQACQ